jgi:hypothetical protein
MIERVNIWSPIEVLKEADICPVSMIPFADEELYHDVLRAMNRNWLPDKGVFLDQLAVFCQAFNHLSGVFREQMEKDRGNKT